MDPTKVLLLAADLFEDIELLYPLYRLQEEDIEVTVAGVDDSPVKGKKGHGPVAVDTTVDQVAAADFDALVIPGGYAPDRMRMRHAMVDLTKAIAAAGKPVAAICHGPQMLISAGLLRGRTVTCWPSIAIDVTNAGGRYVDRPVVTDGNLITSRKPDDVPQFTAALIGALEA